MDEKNLPRRKKTRLKDYDYSSNGCYFITVCTKDKKHILAHYKNENAADINFVGADDHGGPQNHSKNTAGAVTRRKIILTPYGKIADKYIRSIENAYDTVFIENYIIMPNHIHLMLLIDNFGPPRSSAPTISSIIGAFKRFTNKESGCSLWQRGFYDRIVRNQAEYEKIWHYTEYNDLKIY